MTDDCPVHEFTVEGTVWRGGRRLGKGFFGGVYVAESTAIEGRKAVVKLLPVNDTDSQDSFDRERDFYQRLREAGDCEYVLTLIGSGQAQAAATGERFNFLLLSPVGEASLREHMRPITPAYTLEQALSWLLCIAYGLRHLFRVRTVHGDLHDDNVILTQGGRRMLIVDLGISTRVHA